MSTMKIGFDAKRAYLNHSGLGNYCRYFIAGLQELYPMEEYFLFTPKATEQFTFSGTTILPPWYYKKILSSYWRTYKIPKELQHRNIELYHGLSNELPLGIHKFKGAKVVSIHDVIFLRFQELYKPIDVKIYTAKWRYAAKHADLIIVNSTQTKEDVVHYFGVKPEIIHNLGVDCLEVFHTPATLEEVNAVRERYTLPAPYILSVGTIEKRKDQLTALQAWHQTGQHKNIHFVFVGRASEYKRQLIDYIQKHHLQAQVHFLQVQSNRELAALYKGALFSVYISTFEGFGIPIIESMNQGTPVLVSDSSCLPETAGGAGLYAKTGSVEDVKEKMIQLLEDTVLRQELSDAGFIQSKKFRKEKAIPELMQLYKSVL